MTAPQHVEAFQAWMLAADYRPLTANAYASRVASIMDTKLDHNSRYAARSYLSFIRFHRYHEEPEVLARLDQAAAAPVDETAGLSSVQVRRKRQRDAKRKLAAKSFSDADWASLLAAVQADDSVEAAVIGVLMTTGLRIGDCFAITDTQLVEGFASGRILVPTKGGEYRELPIFGAEDAWRTLDEAWTNNTRAGTVLELVQPGGGAYYSGHPAYQRVAQKLRELAEKAGIEGQRVHPHRLRRTLAVQALRETGDVGAVQQLLGHASSRTTLGYLDEARPDDVAKLQQKIQQKYGKKKP